MNDLIKIEYSKNEKEIINVRYDVNNTNHFIDENLGQIENLLVLNSSNNWFNNTNYLVVMVPVGMLFNNLYFDSMGPKIPFKIYYMESFYANLYTKITNYGINNSLVELFIVVTVKYQIIGYRSKTIKKTYDYLLAATLINGKVPNMYNEGIVKESNKVELK